MVNGPAQMVCDVGNTVSKVIVLLDGPVFQPFLELILRQGHAQLYPKGFRPECMDIRTVGEGNLIHPRAALCIQKDEAVLHLSRTDSEVRNTMSLANLIDLSRQVRVRMPPIAGTHVCDDHSDAVQEC